MNHSMCEEGNGSEAFVNHVTHQILSGMSLPAAQRELRSLSYRERNFKLCAIWFPNAPQNNCCVALKVFKFVQIQNRIACFLRRRRNYPQINDFRSMRTRTKNPTHEKSFFGFTQINFRKKSFYQRGRCFGDACGEDREDERETSDSLEPVFELFVLPK